MRLKGMAINNNTGSNQPMNTSGTPDNIKTQASAWWVRMDSGTMAADEQATFEAWVNANEAHKEAFNQVNHIWQELDGIKDRLAAAMPPPARKTSRFNPWQWGLASLAAIYLLFVIAQPINIWLRTDESTGIAEMRTVQLADGSTAQLNSESALSINITNTGRELTLLKGEAQFKVAPDPSRPFKVQAGNGVITALGTAFNVHQGKATTEVTVTEHSVLVQLNNDAENQAVPITLTNGQQVAYNPDTGLGEITNADTQLATAWQRGKLVFQGKPLGEVITELNHYHRGYFLIADPTIANRRVNGVFSTDKPIAALDTIEKSLNLRSNRLSHYLVLLHR
jgi:transmembrane sensor